jgi:5-methylthioribose kinase
VGSNRRVGLTSLAVAIRSGDIGRMQQVDQQNAEEYLRETGRVGADERVVVRELPGGVSNMVLLVERPDRPADEFVLKQARAQLRTQKPWFSSVERAWREADVLRICGQLLERASSNQPDEAGLVAQTPRIVFEDRNNCLFAITAAPRPNRTWKEDLLAGNTDPAVAAACGRLLSTLHAESWRDPDIARQIGDRTLFEELRVAPYYRTLAATRDDARAPLERLIDSLAKNSCSLVHADFSPKNLLLFSGGLLMVDFETGHYGDPAFDLGFFLSHLVLKAGQKIPRHADYLALSEVFQQAYDGTIGPKISARERDELWTRAIQHFAACAWARLDGKSPVEYLTDTGRRESIRSLCRSVFRQEPTDWPEVIELCRQQFDGLK